MKDVQSQRLRAEATATTTSAPRATSARRVYSTELFAGAEEVIIEHNGREYRLRVTRNQKLILTA